MLQGFNILDFNRRIYKKTRIRVGYWSSKYRPDNSSYVWKGTIWDNHSRRLYYYQKNLFSLKKLLNFNFFHQNDLIKSVDYNKWFNINNSSFRNKPLMKLRSITIYKGFLANYHINFTYIKISKKPLFISLNKNMVRKNLLLLDSLLSNLFRYSYNFYFLGNLKYSYEVNSLNFMNNKSILNFIISRATTPALWGYFLEKVQKLPRTALFILDHKMMGRVKKTDAIVFNFLHMGKRESASFYTILLDLSFYFNLFLAINYFYVVKIIGINLKLISYLSLYNYFKENINLIK